MSVDDLHAFIKKLESDESLRQEVVALDASSDEDRYAALHALAAREGFEVTAADWQNESVGAAVDALEDGALRSVVGAGCGDNAGFLIANSVGAMGVDGCGLSVGAVSGNGC